MAQTDTPIDEILFRALKIESEADRAEYLNEVCGTDADLRARVEKLLGAYLEAGSFLDSPAVPAPTIDQPITEKPGTQIGPYKLLQQLGEGGMGVVYMAEQREPVKRRVALKIIKPGMDTRQVIARFEAERQALAMMDHPNIAKVLDAGQTESGRPYFVMELVKGVHVTHFCDKQHLNPKERLELFVPICQAVQHAHQKGIIHRDIKPSNILVALYDGRPVPKIIDFGVAKATSQALTEKTMFTQLGQVVGTLEYMSPEQAQMNQLDIDTRSDIYSLGVVLYELLTGEPPFDRERLRSAAFDEMLRIIREEEPSKPSTKVSSSQSLPSIAANRRLAPAKLGSMIRGELDWIVLKALEKDRGRRYETASQFAADVQNYLDDEPVIACPPTLSYRLGKFVRRHRGPAMATVATLIFLVTGIIWSAAAWKMTTEALRKQEAETQRANEETQRANEETQRANELASALQQQLYQPRISALDLETRARRRRRGLGLFQQLRSSPLVSSGSDRPGLEYRILEDRLRPENWSNVRELDVRASAIAYAPGRDQLAVAGADGRLQLFSSQSLEQLWQVGEGQTIGEEALALSTAALAFSPDGALLATNLLAANKDANQITLVDVATGEVRRRIPFQKEVRRLSFSPDGRSIAVGCGEGWLVCWPTNGDDKDWEALLWEKGARGDFDTISWSPDGQVIAVNSGTPTVRLISSDGQDVANCRHERKVVGLAFRAPENRLHTIMARGWFSQSVSRAWNGSDGKQLAKSRRLWVPFRARHGVAVVAASDAPVMAGHVGPAEIVLWNHEESNEVLSFVEREQVSALALSRNGMQVACILNSTGVVRVRDVPTNRSLTTRCVPYWFSPLAVSPCSGEIAMAGGGYSLKIWHPSTGLVRRPGKHDDRILAVAYSTDGRYLASASRDGVIRVWDMHDPVNVRLIRDIQGVHRGAVWCLLFRGNDELFSGGEYGEIFLHDLQAESPPSRVCEASADGGDRVFALAAYCDDGREVLMSGGGRWNWHGKIRHWQQRSDSKEWELKGTELFPKLVYTLAFAPDGSYAVGDRTGTVTVWNREGQQVFKEKLSGYVASIAFSPSGDRLVVSSPGSLQFVRTADYTHAGTLKSWEDFRSVRFVDAETLVTTSNEVGLVRLWQGP